MIAMLAMGSKRIGMTVDASGIRYATLRKKNGWEIEKTGFYPFPPGLIEQDGIINDESLRISIRQWAKEERLQGASAILAVPTSQVIVRRLVIPAVNEKELRELIHLEVETAMHLPFDNPVYDYVPVVRGEETTQVLVYAAPRSWIDPLVSMLREARIKVVGTGIAATAIQGAVNPLNLEPPSGHMYIHLKGASVEIAMFHEGNPVFIRSIDEDGTSEGLSGLRVGELTAEISRMLSFYQFGIHEGSSKITKGILSGGGDSAKTLMNALRQALPDVDFYEAGAASIAAGMESDIAENYLVPGGLLVRSESVRQLTLLPRIDRETRYAPLAVSLIVVAWIACAALSVYGYAAATADSSRKEERILALGQERLALQRQISKAGSSAASGSDPYEQAEQLRASKQDVAALARGLEEILPPASRLVNFRYAKGGQLLADVRMATLGDASKYLFDLRRVSWIGHAEMNTIAAADSGAVLGPGDAGTASAFTVSYSIRIMSANQQQEKEATADGTAP